VESKVEVGELSDREDFMTDSIHDKWADDLTNESFHYEWADNGKTVHIILEGSGEVNVRLLPMEPAEAYLSQSLIEFFGLQKDSQFKFTAENGAVIRMDYDSLENEMTILARPLDRADSVARPSEKASREERHVYEARRHPTVRTGVSPFYSMCLILLTAKSWMFTVIHNLTSRGTSWPVKGGLSAEAKMVHQPSTLLPQAITL
jgi:hypothetical protein